LVLVEPYWARAWKCVLRGQPVPPPPESQPRAAKVIPRTREPASAWSVLGLQPGARAADVKRAFQKKALETHPDQGGESAQFRAVLRAYERLSGKPKRVRKRG
jgi:DnaJ domain